MVAYFHCLPEGHEENAFDIGIDFKEQELIFNSLSQKNIYVAHAEWRLYDAYEETGKIPTEEISMWY